MTDGDDDCAATVLLQRENDQLTLTVRLAFDKQGISFGLPMPESKLVDLRERVPQFLDPFRERVGQPNVKLSEELAMAAREDLSLAAWATIDLVCKGSSRSPRSFINEIRTYLQPIFSEAVQSNARPPVVRLEATATDPLAWLLPLELWPIAGEEAKPGTPIGLAVMAYLGFSATVVRCQREGPRIVARDSNGLLPVKAFSYRGGGLLGIRRQMDFLSSAESGTTIVQDWPSRTDAATPQSSLADTLLHGDNILHFCCHYDPQSQIHMPEPGLDFGTTKVKIWQLRGAMARSSPTSSDGSVLDKPSQLRPFVFLNACQTAGAAGSGESLFGLLVEHHYQDIVGSETLLPDRVAGEFAVRFYTNLLQNTLFGEALLQARKDLLAIFNNPAGILYTFYGNPSLQLAPPPSDRPPNNATRERWTSRLSRLILGR